MCHQPFSVSTRLIALLLSARKNLQVFSLVSSVRHLIFAYPLQALHTRAVRQRGGGRIRRAGSGHAARQQRQRHSLRL